MAQQAGQAMNAAADSTKAAMNSMSDSAKKADTTKNAVQKAAAALSAPSDTVNEKMEAKPAAPKKH
jgi:ABC-type transporter Mla subunit MlaD